MAPEDETTSTRRLDHRDNKMIIAAPPTTPQVTIWHSYLITVRVLVCQFVAYDVLHFDKINIAGPMPWMQMAWWPKQPEPQQLRIVDVIVLHFMANAMMFDIIIDAKPTLLYLCINLCVYSSSHMSHSVNESCGVSPRSPVGWSIPNFCGSECRCYLNCNMFISATFNSTNTWKYFYNKLCVSIFPLCLRRCVFVY